MIRPAAFLVCCFAVAVVHGNEATSLSATTAAAAPEPAAQTNALPESDAAHRQRCAQAAKKARRKSLWAVFLLSMLSGASNTMSATQKSNVTFTDDAGRKTKGTISYVDPVKRDYLNARDREFNANAAAEIHRNSLQKADCL